MKKLDLAKILMAFAVLFSLASIFLLSAVLMPLAMVMQSAAFLLLIMHTAGKKK